MIINWAHCMKYFDRTTYVCNEKSDGTFGGDGLYIDLYILGSTCNLRCPCRPIGMPPSGTEKGSSEKGSSNCKAHESQEFRRPEG